MTGNTNLQAENGPGCPDCSVLTMAFVNMQPFSEGYDPALAFRRGTLWEDLDKPWEAAQI